MNYLSLLKPLPYRGSFSEADASTYSATKFSLLTLYILYQKFFKLSKFLIFGAPPQTRTAYPQIKSLVLYRLS